MKGPFRIAAAGLCMAFLGMAVATLSHMRNHHQPPAYAVARPGSKRSEARVSIAAVSPKRMPEHTRHHDNPGAEVAQVVSAARPGKTIEAIPARQIRSTATFPRSPSRSDDFRHDRDAELPLEITPRPASAHHEVSAELASLRRDFERLIDEQRQARLQSVENSQRDAATRQTDHELRTLRQTVEQLQTEQREQRRTGEKSIARATIIMPPAEDEAVLPFIDVPRPSAADLPRSVEEASTANGPALPAPVAIEKSVAADDKPARRPVNVTPAHVNGLYDFELEAARIDSVLAAIGQVGGWNIVSSPEVDGVISAVWQNVTPQQALDALLTSRHLTSTRQATFLVVTTNEQAEAKNGSPKPTTVQLYRPNFISGRDLVPLIEPLLTAEIGHVGVTLPHSSEDALLEGGGDSLAQTDAIVVVDFPDVIDIVTKTIAELDVPAPHVELEATIVDVRMSGKCADGVSQLLKTGAFDRRTKCVPLDGGQSKRDVCCQMTDQPCGDVLKSLQNWTDVRVVSTARLQVLNKQPAELCVGEASFWNSSRRGPMSEPLEDSTSLLVRPFICGHQLIRLDVAPELASGLNGNGGIARQAFASIRTSVAVPNCGTLVIAGLNVEECVAPKSGLFKPWTRFGGGKNKSDSVERRELVVMISPRIVEQGMSSHRVAEEIPVMPEAIVE
jgi:hypothetical protein